jgi:hypothetical protein
MIGDDGTVIGRVGHLLKPNDDGAGYLKMVMCLPGNRRKTVRVHRLVCEAFHGPPPSPAHLVAHRDGNRQNNRAGNLRWATHIENESDKRAHGRTSQGERHGAAKLSVALVREARRLRRDGASWRFLARRFGVAKRTIQTAVTGETWASVA